MTAFWEMYEALCRERDIAPASQQQADRLGATRSGITSWKQRDVIPRIETLALIADEFGVSLDYLMGRTQIRGLASESTDSSTSERTGEPSCTAAALMSFCSFRASERTNIVFGKVPVYRRRDVGLEMQAYLNFFRYHPLFSNFTKFYDFYVQMFTKWSFWPENAKNPVNIPVNI